MDFRDAKLRVINVFFFYSELRNSKMVDEVLVGGHAVPLPIANSVTELLGYRPFVAGCGIGFSLRC